MSKPKCSMIDVQPDEDGMGVEYPCQNEAVARVPPNGDPICFSCLMMLRREEMEEAFQIQPLGDDDDRGEGG